MSNDVLKDSKLGPAGAEVYRIGTLEYTKRGLFMLFIWLMWGDFCFSLMESVFPTITPLTLGHLGARNIIIGLVITTIPNILNFLVCPWISFKSDRHRSKLGRRIPFLLYPTPIIALFLVLIGLSPDIGRFLHHALFSHTGVSQTAIILLLIGVFSTVFQYFNMFVASVYYYLFNDVVPDQFLGRFMAAFRIVGSLAGAVFNFFVFRYAETHMKWIFIGAGLLYFIAFMQMSLKVKEGEYPAPPEYVDGKQGVLSGIKTYFKECFVHKFYWYFFLGTAAAELTVAVDPFILLMQRDALGLTPWQIGKIAGTAGIVTMFLLLPAGMISDKRHPLRTTLVSTGILALLYPLRFAYLFYHFTPQQAYHYEFIICLLLIPAVAIFKASNLPMYMRLLPPERYGQFCSAQAMVRSLLMIAVGMLVGGTIDLLAVFCRKHGMPGLYYYKFAPLLLWLFWAISFILLIPLYRLWKNLGGDENYKAPAVGRAAEVEPAVVRDTVHS